MAWLAVLSATAPIEAADGTGGIGLAPAHSDPRDPATGTYFIPTVAPGGSFRDRVIVTNSGSARVALYVDPVDGLTGETSGAVYGNRTDPLRKAGFWVTPDVSRLTINAQSSTSVGFTVHVPADANSGDHLAGIAFQDIHTTTSGGTLSVTTVIRSVIGVLVEVPGPGAFQPRITGARIEALAGFGTPSVLVTLGDAGLRLGKPVLSVTLAGPDGYRRTLTRQLDTLLPGDTIELPLPWPDRLAAGDYEITVVASGSGHTAPITFTTTAHLGADLETAPPGSAYAPATPVSVGGWSVPLVLVGGACIALGGACIALGLVAWRRRSRRLHGPG